MIGKKAVNTKRIRTLERQMSRLCEELSCMQETLAHIPAGVEFEYTRKECGKNIKTLKCKLRELEREKKMLEMR